MLPVIVLIGRTNVGKSTLFNVLSKTRNALVANYPGLTKDRNYGSFYLEKNKKIIIIDTSGINSDSKKSDQESHEQTLIAIEECNVILFIVSARDGVMPEEYEIAKKIRKYQKKTIVVINKIDGIKEDSKINEFYSLGFKDNVKISASHNQGINNLIIKYLTPWIKKNFTINDLKEKTKKYTDQEKLSIKIACIGKPNVGKSTLINKIIMKKRLITSEIPGTTLDSIHVPIQYNKKNYIFIDTAGLSRKSNNKIIEKFSTIKTLQTIEKSNVILLVIDAINKICKQDLLLANFIEESGKPLIIVFNKWDLLNFSEKKDLKNSIKNKLKCCFFSKIHFISALLNEGIFEIFKSINEIYKLSTRKINTSFLMKTMHTAIKKHQPPIINGRRIKLKYAHLGSSNPVKIIIHGNQVKDLSLSYKKYLKNFFNKELKTNGTSIKIEFKESTNPYILKK
ncbi:ribosome biogenesis GTPase Der [Buchnera aphidicola]|uniref:ribosome biogenesis GTPase Der n=1 Tax=Buchnera aphidicola TaxID=9 RepID=UPI0034638674